MGGARISWLTFLLVGALAIHPCFSKTYISPGVFADCPWGNRSCHVSSSYTSNCTDPCFCLADTVPTGNGGTGPGRCVITT
uniref:Hypothetical secreted peptide n=1 Tax=Hyalomma rufipes TaxID=72862 RepID=E2J6S2_HYARU